MTTLDLARPPGRTAAAPPGHRWLMLAVLLGGQLMALIDAFVVNVAMPSIGADLHASGAALQLVVGGYAAAYAMLLITGARLGDLYGRRRVYLLGVVMFTAASLACGLAPDSGVLIVARCAQGAAAAVKVAQPRPRDQQHRVGGGVPADHQLQRRAGGVQASPDRRQRHVDDEGVEQRHELPAEQDGQHQPAVTGRRRGLLRPPGKVQRGHAISVSTGTRVVPSPVHTWPAAPVHRAGPRSDESAPRGR